MRIARLGRILPKAVGAGIRLRRRLQRWRAHRFNMAHAPELARAYCAFERNNQISRRRQPLKGHDLWKLLDAEKPSSVVELGSGTTSAVFSLWAKRHGITYVSFEHHPAWAGVTEACLREAELLPGTSPVLLVESRVSKGSDSTGFVKPVPLDADFVYVDGPPCRIASGRKVANDDVIRLFDAGGRPRTIVVDGRHATVDRIRAHRAGHEYAFVPGYDYCLTHGLWWRAMRGGEHTVFRRRPSRDTTVEPIQPGEEAK